MTTICITSKGDYWKERLVIETLLRCSGQSDIELLLLNNGTSTENKTVQFVDELLNLKIYPNLVRTGTINEPASLKISDYEAYNRLFKEAKPESRFFCIVGSDVVLGNGWLDALLYHSKTIFNSGICSIQDAEDKIEYISCLTNEDTLLRVLKPKNESFTGACLFNKDLFVKADGFQEVLQLPFEAFYKYLLMAIYTHCNVPEQFLVKI